VRAASLLRLCDVLYAYASVVLSPDSVLHSAAFVSKLTEAQARVLAALLVEGILAGIHCVLTIDCRSCARAWRSFGSWYVVL
jgi:hypothetical protein